MLESRVPSTRLGRLWQYGGLATSMAFGALGETMRRATGTVTGDTSSVMFSAGNTERLVAKLSKMRGAALKLGQMMSLQSRFQLGPTIN
jgi:aarF domain-containing kinase